MERSWATVVWALVFALGGALVAGMARGEGGAFGSGLGRAGGAVRMSAPAAGDLRLSEILATPSRDWDGDGVYVARQDEWLEVVNAGLSTVDLGGFLISDNDSTVRFALSGSLAPGALLLVTGRMAEDWQRSVGRTITGLSLNNSGDTVRLFRIEGADTVEVDTKTYNSIEGGTDRSTGRLGSDPGAWVLFDALNRYTGTGEPQGTGCAPTPGLKNECPTPVETTTWGKIKMRFR
jgi:Lamin Tail Domain